MLYFSLQIPVRQSEYNSTNIYIYFINTKGLFETKGLLFWEINLNTKIHDSNQYSFRIIRKLLFDKYLLYTKVCCEFK